MSTAINLEALKPLVEYLTAKNVKRFKMGEMELEFDTVTAAVTGSFSGNIDPRVEKIDTTKKTLQDLLEDQDQDLYWSSGK